MILDMNLGVIWDTLMYLISSHFLEYKTYSKVKDFEASPRRLDSVWTSGTVAPNIIITIKASEPNYGSD